MSSELYDKYARINCIDQAIYESEQKMANGAGAIDAGLTGLWFDGEKYFAACLDPEHEEKDTPVHMMGTPFQLTVWKILQKIPYGKTVTYGEIAKEIAAMKGLPRMSAQAVGSAVGHNKISIIIPCHRVVGTNKSLTGYAGGIDKKVKLLTMENIDMNPFFVPRKGTAL